MILFNLNSISRKTKQTTKMETASSSEIVVHIYIPEGTAQLGVEFDMVSCTRIYKGVQFKIQTPAHWNLICRSMTDPTACVIAQHYSSAYFPSLR